MSDYGLDWSDFSSDSATTNVALLLSVRSQSLLLAAIQQIQARHMWLETDDSEFDDIQEALAECITEILTEVETVTDATPVGALMNFIGLAVDVPVKWLLCDGATYVGTDYPDLFAILPSALVSGGNFTLPALSGRFIRGAVDDSAVADIGGELNHTLTIAELPAHHHVVPAHDHTFSSFNNAGAGGSNVVASGSSGGAGTKTSSTEAATDTSDAGSGNSFGMLPPYQRFCFIIKALP